MDTIYKEYHKKIIKNIIKRSCLLSLKNFHDPIPINLNDQVPTTNGDNSIVGALPTSDIETEPLLLATERSSEQQPSQIYYYTIEQQNIVSRYPLKAEDKNRLLTTIYDTQTTQLDLKTKKYNTEKNSKTSNIPDINFYRLHKYKDIFCTIIQSSLIFFNKKMEIKQTFQCKFIQSCQDIFISGTKIFMVSTLFDAIIVFDLKSNKFIEGYQINHNKTANCIYIAPFDPVLNNSDTASYNYPQPNNEMGLSSAFVKGDSLYFYSNKFNLLFYAKENGSLHKSLSIPDGTCFVKNYKNGIIMENISNNSIEYINMEGEIVESFSLEPASKKEIKLLSTTSDDLIIAASSLSHIYIYQSGNNKPVNHFEG
ncbi:hypothetical protein MTBBW1_2380038 [Desulfamplus magnetovallimortis]|uniref:Uncharacterized protein n=1 Tax=Desulfamplus magnetovallimortis TaxID=1246637 RepID=A0A1W1HDZ0_9BACT|nr:hypothetical protein [Desulfamplus magnetovallimortis]SLM30714.1 hypothetical protein MTBBW1_2380038 [Desulfamplus magnetovallimortis]